MPVVTIRGQLGSRAPEIGKQVAERLHVDYVDREVIAKVAELLGWSKQGIELKETPPDSLLTRIAATLGRVPPFDGAGLPTWEIPLGDAHYLAGLEFIIKELAGSQSIVIRGRGSQFILKNHPGALHVLVVAPLELRLKRVMENLKLDEETARKEITRFDGSGREFIKRYFQAELDDPVHYDLVINTNHLSSENAASIVVNALAFTGRAGP